MAIPLLPDDLTPDALTALLTVRRPDAVVTAVEFDDVREVTNTHVRVTVEYAIDAGLPRSLFVKMVPREETRRRQVAQTDMGRREVRFYDELAPQLDFRVPTPYGTGFDPADGSFVLVLEDSRPAGARSRTAPSA